MIKDLQHIRFKVEELVALNQQLKLENFKLKSELEDLKLSLMKREEKISELEEQNKIVKIAEAISKDSNDSRAVKLRINEFIREIDRCIATLSD